jgi:hypothetical protein
MEPIRFERYIYKTENGCCYRSPVDLADDLHHHVVVCHREWFVKSPFFDLRFAGQVSPGRVVDRVAVGGNGNAMRDGIEIA